MPELYNKDATRAVAGPHAQIGYGLPSTPVYGFDAPMPERPAEESIFHPVRAINDIIDAIQTLTQQVNLLVKDTVRERTFVDRAVGIGATIQYTVDFLERKYLYALSGAAVTLNISTGGTLALTANTWMNISFSRGTTITVSGGSDAAPTVVYIRACDVRM